MRYFFTLLCGLSLMCLATFSGKAQIEKILNPIPQTYSFQSETIDFNQTAHVISHFPTSSYALQALLQSITENPKGITLLFGKKGDKHLKPFNKFIPTKAEGYYLSITPKQIVIAGADERGAFYGLQTFKQLTKLQKNKLPIGTISDFPDVKYRGVVEGFYGQPWSFENRLKQFDFYGTYKLNVYIYGPKDDPYHSSPNWRKPYPKIEAEQIQTLVKHAHNNGVIFYWAIHPGKDIQWTKEDRDLLLAKFESMYALGVRAFAVFFDDIWGEGAKAERQVELLNDIDINFIKKKGDVAPLVMCPTEYNKSWSNIKGGYLPTLGDKLNKDIEIMWTGNTVVACIDKPDMDWINQHIKRKAYIWWNFPVSDYSRDHLLLGRVYGNSLAIKNDVSGFLSNPMEHAESSKVALYSVADYTWNMQKFNSEQSWEKALKAILPNQFEAFRTFARHSSDLGENGHRFRREESENLKEDLSSLLKNKTQDPRSAIKVVNECMQLEAAANILLASKDNVSLIQEMKPWLQQAKLLGEYGQEVVKMLMLTNNTLDFLNTYQHAKSLQTLMYELDQEANQNPYQPGVKVGSLRLKPTLDKLFTEATIAFNKATGENLETKAYYLPFAIESNVSQLSDQPLRTKGNILFVNPSLEVINWDNQHFFMIKGTLPFTLSSFSVDLGVKDKAQAFKCEVLKNNSWITLPLKQQGNTLIAQLPENLKQQKVEAVKLTQISGTTLQVYFKQCKLVQ